MRHIIIAGVIALLFAMTPDSINCARADNEAAVMPHAVILHYQNINTDATAKSQTASAIDPALLKRQMQYLRDNHFTVLPLADLVQRLRSGKSLPDRSVAISFDGATRNICDTVSPLLVQMKIPFTLFVDTAPIDAGNPAYCSWSELQTLAADGVTFGNRSINDDHLVHRHSGESLAVWQSRVRGEILGAEQRLLEQTGQSTHLLAWPYGEFNEATKALVRDAGFIAFGQQPGAVGPYSDWQELPRFTQSAQGPNNASLKSFAAKLEALPLPVQSVRKPDSPLLREDGIPSAELVLQPMKKSNFTPSQRKRLNCSDSDGKRINAIWLSETRLRVKAHRDLPLGVSGYHCHLPAEGDHYYWYSVTWITADKNGNWPSPH